MYLHMTVRFKSITEDWKEKEEKEKPSNLYLILKYSIDPYILADI